MNSTKGSAKQIFIAYMAEKGVVVNVKAFEKAYKKMLRWAKAAYGEGSEADLLSSVEDEGGVSQTLEVYYKETVEESTGRKTINRGIL